MTHLHALIDAAPTEVSGAVVPPYPPPPLAATATNHYSYLQFFSLKKHTLHVLS
jgi:hypothetical protein